MATRSEQALSQAYDLILHGDPSSAKQILDDNFAFDLDNADISVSIKFCSFWENIYYVRERLQPFKAGSVLLEHWDKFLALVSEHEAVQGAPVKEGFVEAFKEATYRNALESFSCVDPGDDVSLAAELKRRMSLCYKRLGDYETALSLITEANAMLPNQAHYVAELADCHDLCGNVKIAKLLFKEAFYIDSQRIELGNLDSKLIAALVEKVRSEGFEGALVQEWLPVYGTLTGVLNMKRDLKPQELVKLLQDIKLRKTELKDPANNEEILKPRLMNMYLRLMEYYLLRKEDVVKINSLMLNIQLLDKDLYQKFFKVGQP